MVLMFPSKRSLNDMLAKMFPLQIDRVTFNPRGER